MDYRIEKREPFKVVAKTRLFNNEMTSQEGNHDIADFWKKSINEDVFLELEKSSIGGDTYGVCGIVDHTSHLFKYGIGMEYDDGIVGEDLEIWEVESTLWVVFQCKGDSPDCLGETWNKIFSEFLPESEYKILERTDFELYPSNPIENVFCEIWVPIAKK